MVQKEKLVCLFDQLDENDQKKAYEFIRNLAHQSGGQIENKEVSKLFGKRYYVVSD